MCGVVGFKSDEKPPRKWHKRLARTLICSESRGDHATGVFLWDGDRSILVKNPEAATRFVKGPDFKSLADWKPLVCLAHTRYATQGSRDDNKNNHPLEYGQFVLIHNGIIWNDAELRKRYHLPAKPEVDSFVILALIQRFFTMYRSVTKAIEHAHSMLRGSYVCVLFDKKDGKVYPFRNGNAWHVDKSRKGEIWWASEDDILKGIKRKVTYSRGYSSWEYGYGDYAPYQYTHAGSQYGYNRVVPGAGVHSRFCDCYLCEQDRMEEKRLLLPPARELGHTKPMKIEGGFPVRCRSCDQPYYWTPRVQCECPTCGGRGWSAVSETDMDLIINSWVDSGHGVDCECEACTAPDSEIPEMSRAEADAFRREINLEIGGTSASVELED